VAAWPRGNCRFVVKDEPWAGCVAPERVGLERPEVGDVLGDERPLSGDRGRNDGGRTMRALDCTHPSHDTLHVTAENDDKLVEIVRGHIAEAHQDTKPGAGRFDRRRGRHDE